MLTYTFRFNIRVVGNGNLLVFKYVLIDFAIPNLTIIKTAFKTSFQYLNLCVNVENSQEKL